MTEGMSEWFYTAPMEDIAVRRGDPLGMRAVAEDMAEVLAPGLSNRTMDGRWLSILCWALQQSYSAWCAFGVVADGGYVATRDAAIEIYSWLRPLELLWVARTIAKTEDQGKGRQLPGVRAVRNWIDGDARSERFGLALNSYSRYRFTGIYGAYRAALRSLPGLTVGGDGWRLGPLGNELSKVVCAEVRCSRTHLRRKGKRPTPERYWEVGFEWDSGRTGFLPTVLADPRRFANPEREFLRRAIFSSTEGSDAAHSKGRRRRAVAEAAARSSATTRPALLADGARALGGGKPPDELALLAPFSELADGGVAAMNACWAAVAEGNAGGFARASSVLAQVNVAEALDGLVEAARRWKRDSPRGGRRIVVADALAESVCEADSRKRQFQALERHHNRFGGGLKWLALEGDTIKPLAPIRGGDASMYSFRIGALTRLGIQAGIINRMPKALRDSNELVGEVNAEGEG